MTPTTAPLRPREDTELPVRLARSAAQRDSGAHLRTADVLDWLDSRRRAHRFRVGRIPFSGLGEWAFDEVSGNLGHRSGRFFTVEGLHVRIGPDAAGEWQQPVIRQPETGILGILAKEFDGVLHFLMQAKMEPGNPGLVQLSPTVQATRSNYTRAHRGSPVRYIDYFLRRPLDGGVRVLADVLQSEHGSWFFRKFNRNMLVETDGEVPGAPDFCWLTLGQLGELLRYDNVVNMDARTVLACAPVAYDERHARHPDAELLSWFTGERARREVEAALMPLKDVAGWRRGPWSIDHEQGRHFSVVAVSVEAASREVGGWSQPLIEPVGTGVTAFLARRFAGVPHLLVCARTEGGLQDGVELGPTLQCTPQNHAHLPPSARPRFLDTVLGAAASRIRYQAVHSEEGGRFLNAQSRYLIVDWDEQDDGGGRDADPPPGYRWMTPGQLGMFARHSHYLNVQARTLLACLTTGAVRL
ncbi:NDP-hexose 2,3-dehydratase [Streptomyces sp. F-3]|jgi:oxidase EvaA|uniref:NDP-hexose 2,3-dehydratase family protein n=1 Tax=Streptomyces thermogriseus TaxID=75292 RepID=A0ABP4DIG8_9ACTN|nr:NDP-hexose 2,3-dehydratase family protein [Streptomyces sp. F-3]GAT80787.1 NDP-hexose 2,3-dehydratase [Streptomyces sp. F-3]